MKRRRLILIGALTAVVAGIVIFWPRGPKEPVYQGKKLSQWLAEAPQEVDADGFLSFSVDTKLVRKAIQSIGTNALPWLLYEFTRTEPGWRATVRRWKNKFTRSRPSLSDHEIRVFRATGALQLLGPAVAPALPELSQCLATPEIGHTAASIMVQAGERAVPYFVQCLRSTHTAAHRASIYGLGRLAQATDAAIPPFIEFLRSTNTLVRETVVLYLQGVKSRPDLVIPALAGALSDSSPGVQMLAAWAFQMNAPSARPAVPELKRLLTNSNSRVVSAASNALFRIDPAALPPRRTDP